MASTSTSLDAAATERRARLAKLRSLKRKQPSDDQPPSQPADDDGAAPLAPSEPTPTSSGPDGATARNPVPQPGEDDIATKYLSGRNYDTALRGPKLGFEQAPSAGQETVESRAARLANEAREAAAADKERAEKQALDLFALQPKKPNWDLKRDLSRRLEPLEVRTENAIARLVRERIAAQKGGGGVANGGAKADGGGAAGAEGAGALGGGELVEGIHQREREEQEDERREREAEDEEA